MPTKEANYCCKRVYISVTVYGFCIVRNTHSKASSLAPIYTETYVTMSNSSSIEYFTIPHYHHALSLGNYLCMRMIILNCTGLQVPPELNEKHKKLKNHLAAFRAISFHPEPINDFLNQPILSFSPPPSSLCCVCRHPLLHQPRAGAGGRNRKGGGGGERRKGGGGGGPLVSKKYIGKAWWAPPPSLRPISGRLLPLSSPLPLPPSYLSVLSS